MANFKKSVLHPYPQALVEEALNRSSGAARPDERQQRRVVRRSAGGPRRQRMVGFWGFGFRVLQASVQ